MAEMYAADSAAMAGGIPGVELMATAGAAVAQAADTLCPTGPVVVLCGPGNNGGDGFVAARLLAEAGRTVTLFLLGARERLTGDAAAHADLWVGEVHPLEAEALGRTLAAAEGGLVIDALFGAGLARSLEGQAAAAVAAVEASGLPVLAVDLPSGLRGDDGARLGEQAFRAAATVTFFRKKPGHLLLPGRAHCGTVTVADIGIPNDVLTAIAPQCWENDPALWLPVYPRRRLEDHKYRFGHALIFGGGTMTGAGRLAARAALRVGAGLVTVAAPSAALPIYAQETASLITAPLDDAEARGVLLEDPRKNALLVGPGAGVGPETRAHAEAALATGRALVLDADALTVFAGEAEALATARSGPLVLTPHEGEFARLFPAMAASDVGKLEKARAAAAACSAVVILKGADSVVAAPDGRALINGNAPPTLATAGSGDVLAGLLVGLLAQGLPAFEAAGAAVWLQGAAADACGPGLISDDLPERLPEVLSALLSQASSDSL